MVEVKFDLNKSSFVFLFLFIVLVGMGVVYAYGGASSDVMGHSWQEVGITDEMCNYITGNDCAGGSDSNPDDETPDDETSR
jgi:hypothetical protein